MVDDKQAGSIEGGNNDLLNAFNVATFKGEDDDAAFWDRLIPAGTRTQPEDGTPELGLRSARLRGLDEVTALTVSSTFKIGSSRSLCLLRCRTTGHIL